MTEPTDTDGARRAGITFFEPPAEAPRLEEAEVMSFPEVDEDALGKLMEWGVSGGHLVKVLFRQNGDEGMSLIWSWFGPGYILPRHSHSADCLYYVVAGEAHMGKRVIRAGGGFFVPEDAPYAYTAGPEGVQVLEFRGVGTFDMKITESDERWDRIVETVRERSDSWKQAAPTV